jgi:peroxiredoxin
MTKERVQGVLESGLVSVGDAAPNFELPALIGGVRKTFRLSEYRGKTLVLAFHPFNWQAASIQQMVSYQAQRPRVLASNAETVAINVESLMNTTAWERENGPFDFPLCSDFWPHGEVCARYGMLRTSGVGAGASERAICVLNRGGQVVFQKTYGWEEVPPLDEVFSLLEKM